MVERFIGSDFAFPYADPLSTPRQRRKFTEEMAQYSAEERNRLQTPEGLLVSGTGSALSVAGVPFRLLNAAAQAANPYVQQIIRSVGTSVVPSAARTVVAPQAARAAGTQVVPRGTAVVPAAGTQVVPRGTAVVPGGSRALVPQGTAVIPRATAEGMKVVGSSTLGPAAAREAAMAAAPSANNYLLASAIGRLGGQSMLGPSSEAQMPEQVAAVVPQPESPVTGSVKGTAAKSVNEGAEVATSQNQDRRESDFLDTLLGNVDVAGLLQVFARPEFLQPGQSFAQGFSRAAAARTAAQQAQEAAEAKAQREQEEIDIARQRAAAADLTAEAAMIKAERGKPAFTATQAPKAMKEFLDILRASDKNFEKQFDSAFTRWPDWADTRPNKEDLKDQIAFAAAEIYAASGGRITSSQAVRQALNQITQTTAQPAGQPPAKRDLSKVTIKQGT
jgi:hypothetical protein